MGATVSIRGGIPLPIISGTADVAPAQEYEFRSGEIAGISNFIHFENLDAVSDIILSFSRADAVAGVGITVPAVLGSQGNPIELAIEADRFFVQAAAPAAFKALVLVRRG